MLAGVFCPGEDERENVRLLASHREGKEDRFADACIRFVNIRPGKTAESIEYYVVPSAVVVKKMISGAGWHQFNSVDAKPYRDKWNFFPCVG